jgi:lipoate-protein ligase A
MKYLELTFSDPAQNLACDEALLEWYEAHKIDDGLLRIWQPQNHFVVLGHSNCMNTEANVAVCAAEAIPIMRRISGGGTVLQGPGCLNYSLVLDCDAHRLRNLAATFRYVLERHQKLLSSLAGAEICVDGISDLTLAGRKFSGNAQYRKARYALVHGTFLLNFDLLLLDRCLRFPSRQPDYRKNRAHLEFVTNFQIDASRLRAGLREVWQAGAMLKQMPLDHMLLLVQQRYGFEAWTRKF